MKKLILLCLLTIIMIIAADCEPDTTELCPNGLPDAGEECDDGNNVATDTCSSCLKTSCGDQVVQSPNGYGQSEQCDPIIGVYYAPVSCTVNGHAGTKTCDT